MTDSPSLEELWSWSDEGGWLTEKERVYCTGTVSHIHNLLSLTYFLSTSVSVLHCFHLSLSAVSHTCSLHLFHSYRNTHTHTYLYAQVFSSSVSPHFPLISLWCEGLSIHHDRGLGWPPVLIRESVISSAQSITTHQRNTV